MLAAWLGFDEHPQETMFFPEFHRILFIPIQQELCLTA